MILEYNALSLTWQPNEIKMIDLYVGPGIIYSVHYEEVKLCAIMGGHPWQCCELWTTTAMQSAEGNDTHEILFLN